GPGHQRAEGSGCPPRPAGERLLADLAHLGPAAGGRERGEEGPAAAAQSQPALQVAHHTIGEPARTPGAERGGGEEEQEEVSRRHEEEVKSLHQKLDLYSDTSLDRFKQNTLDLLKKPSLSVPTSKHLARLAEMEQAVAEQDGSLAALSDRLREADAHAQRQRDRHAAQVKALVADGEELRARATRTEQQLQDLGGELQAQKEANVRSPSNTMKSLVERLKAQLSQKEKQLKGLGKALLDLRAEMTALAERQVVSGAAQREESLNVQTLVDKHTAGLKEAVREETEEVHGDLQRSQKSQGRLQGEKEQRDQEIQELRQRVKRLSNGLQSKEEVVRWEEGKKWQARVEKVRSALREKEAEVESLSKQLCTLKELYGRLEQENKSLLRKTRVRGVTADQVVGARRAEAEEELEGLRRRNAELEVQIVTIRSQQALPRDAAVDELTERNRSLEERLHAMETPPMPKEPPSRPSTSGRGTGTPSQDVQKENLKLSSENLELRLQLAQANREVADLKEMCRVLKKEKAEAEKRLAHVRGAGSSGKTVGDLERTVGLMKRVVERVQRENDALKKSADCEKMKQAADAELSARLESRTRGMEKIVMENERLRREMKREREATERLRVAKSDLEASGERLEAELEETKGRLHAALTRAIPEGADSKTWKASVAGRAERAELKRQLREAVQREERALRSAHALEDQ
ncbi:hypothetical protein CRUP_004935, partial [Coryphaenoides rupestris]